MGPLQGRARGMACAQRPVARADAGAQPGAVVVLRVHAAGARMAVGCAQALPGRAPLAPAPGAGLLVPGRVPACEGMPQPSAVWLDMHFDVVSTASSSLPRVAALFSSSDGSHGACKSQCMACVTHAFMPIDIKATSSPGCCWLLSIPAAPDSADDKVLLSRKGAALCAMLPVYGRLAGPMLLRAWAASLLPIHGQHICPAAHCTTFLIPMLCCILWVGWQTAELAVFRQMLQQHACWAAYLRLIHAVK